MEMSWTRIVSINVRLAYMSHDRSELAYATKEIARSMQTPDQNVADSGTKDADGKSMLRLCGEMVIVKMTGRSEQDLKDNPWRTEELRS